MNSYERFRFDAWRNFDAPKVRRLRKNTGRLRNATPKSPPVTLEQLDAALVKVVQDIAFMGLPAASSPFAEHVEVGVGDSTRLQLSPTQMRLVRSALLNRVEWSTLRFDRDRYNALLGLFTRPPKWTQTMDGTYLLDKC